MSTDSFADFYQAVSIWQGEPEWEIEIHFGQFPTVLEAADWGSNRLTNLKYDKLLGCLIIEDRNSQEKYKISDSQIVVWKQKPECDNKRIMTDEDFSVVQVATKDFPSTPGLDGTFGSLAFGVIDNFGQPVPVLTTATD